MTDAVARRRVLGVGARGDGDGPVGADRDVELVAGDRRVGQADALPRVAPDREGALQQDQAGAGVGSGEHVEGDRAHRDRRHPADFVRRADHEVVAGEDAGVSDVDVGLEHRAGAQQGDRGMRVGEPQLAGQRDGEARRRCGSPRRRRRHRPSARRGSRSGGSVPQAHQSVARRPPLCAARVWRAAVGSARMGRGRNCATVVEELLKGVMGAVGDAVDGPCNDSRPVRGDAVGRVG